MPGEPVLYQKYDEKELERKRKIVMNYWSFAYAKYCVEHEEKVQQNIRETYENLHRVFNGILRDEDPQRAQKALDIIQSANQVHENIKKVEKLRTDTRKKLEELAEDHPEALAKTIRASIIRSCEAFTTEKDKTKVAAIGMSILEHLDAMNANPKLAVEVGLSNEQLSMAAKVVTIGSIIQEGLKCLEMEMQDGLELESKLPSDQHKSNLAKIAAMDVVEKDRLNGNLLKELQKCELLEKTSKEDRFELATTLADHNMRRRTTIAMYRSLEPKQTQPEAPHI